MKKLCNIFASIKCIYWRFQPNYYKFEHQVKPLKLYVFKLFTIIANNHYSGGFRGPPLQSCQNKVNPYTFWQRKCTNDETQNIPFHIPTFSCDLSRFSTISLKYLLNKSTTRDSKTIFYFRVMLYQCSHCFSNTLMTVFVKKSLRKVSYL